MKLGRFSVAALAVGLAASTVPAAAQIGGNDGVSFVQAVRSRDGGKVLELIGSRGETIVNARDLKGETALLAAVRERDDEFTPFLLSKGADPNLAARDGDTPLIVASRLGFGEGVQLLLARNAKVNAANRRGETALIAAVQQRQGPIVKLLLAAGADPDHTDSVAGMSARDYARRDTRSRELLALIEGNGPKAAPKSDSLDSFKLEKN